MKKGKYIKDKLFIIILFLFILFVINLILFSFKTNKQAIIGVNITVLFGFAGAFMYDYFRKKQFYDLFVKSLEQLDRKYLITEVVQEPGFYEGAILYESLYEIDKSMNEKVKEYSKNLNDFKEYIEMWIHEVKLPLSSINLIIHNHKEKTDSKILEQLKRIDDDVEQVLYYARSENAEKDYLIKETYLNRVISTVAMRNKDILLENNIELIVHNVNRKVLTDSKWLEFIINQIISNSIKYIRSETNSYIKMDSEETDEFSILRIYDNGIGIPKKDMSKIFDKTFTGSNGRKIQTSTGMGLYIVKKLCHKLGHKIEICSEENEYTKVSILFNKNDFFNVVEKSSSDTE